MNNNYSDKANLIENADIDPFQHDPESQLEFQEFMLSTAEEDLLAGKIPTQQENASRLQEPILPTTSHVISSQENPNPLTRGNGVFWSFDFWKSYFNVDSKDVGLRMMAAVNPTTSFMTQIGSNPDFYGPFWIPTTVVFLLFASSSIATYFANKPVPVGRLSIAMAITYGYLLIMPAFIYFIARYFKGDTVQLFDMINVYGYGMTVWIPICLLALYPEPALSWVLTVVAFCITTLFLLRTIQPMTATLNDASASSFILGSIVFGQFVLCLAFKLDFLSVTVDIQS